MSVNDDDPEFGTDEPQDEEHNYSDPIVVDDIEEEEEFDEDEVRRLFDSNREERKTKYEDQLMNIRVEPRPSYRTGRSKENQIPPEDVQAALELIADGADPSQDFDHEILRAVIAKLTEIKNRAHKEHKYKEADNYSQLIKLCSKAADVAGFSEKCVTTLSDLIEKQNDAIQVLETVREKWKKEFKEFENVINEKKNALVEQHKKEQDDFDQNIPRELPSKYKKHSPEYIEIRKKEKALARNQDFAAADKVKRQGDRLEVTEDAHQFEKLREDLETRRNNLIEKHNRQVELLAQWVTERRNMMMNSMGKDVDARTKRIEHYTKLINNIEKKGLPPNPNNGFTTNRVNRNDTIKAARKATTDPIIVERSLKKRRQEELPLQYRPLSSVTRRRTSNAKGSGGNK